MCGKMTRRHWLASLFAGLAGAWAVRRGPAAVAPPGPRQAAPVPAVPTANCRGLVTTYGYDAFGRLTWMSDPHVTTYVYDPDGRTHRHHG